MKKNDIIDALREQENLENGMAKKITRLFFDEIAQTLIGGSRVEIRGFCSFAIKVYPSYTGRNPKTGDSVTVEEKYLPVFRGGQELRSRVDQS